MKKYLLVLLLVITTLLGKAQSLDFESVSKYLGVLKTSVVAELNGNNWLFSQGTDEFSVYYKPIDNDIETLGFFLCYDETVLVSYNIPQSYAEKIKHTLSFDNYQDSLKVKGDYLTGYKIKYNNIELLFDFEDNFQEGRCLMQISQFNKKYYSFEQCESLYKNGSFQEVIPSMLKLKKDFEKADRLNENQYSEVIFGLDLSYANLREINKSLAILKSGFTVLSQQDRKGKSPNIRKILAKMGERYRMLHNYSDAEETFMVANDLYIKNKDLGEDYMLLQSQMSLLYVSLHDTINMLKANENVVKIYNKLYGNIFNSNGIRAFMLLNNIALVYYSAGRQNECIKCYRHVVDNLVPNDASTYSIFNYACSNLALLLTAQKRFTESITLIDKIINSNYGLKKNYLDILLANNLFLDDERQIVKYFNEYSDYSLEENSKIFFKSNESDYYNLWLAETHNILFLNFAALKSQIPEVVTKAFESNIFYKNVSLCSDKLIEQYVSFCSDESLKKAYQRCKLLKHNYIFSSEPTATNCYNEYLYTYNSIIKKIDGLGYKLKSQFADFDIISNTINENEYVIDFCMIPYSDNFFNPKCHYGAYIACKTWECPLIVMLPEVEEFDSTYITRPTDPQLFYTEFYKKRTNALYQVLFKTLEQHMPDAKTIYYSPCGNLSQLNFDLFMDDNGTPLNQKYKMVRVSSTANIPQIKALNLKSAKTSTLYGGIDYKNSAETSDVAVRGVDFRNLPNTGNEVRNISRILTAANIKADTLFGENATEQSFKLLSGNSPDILHVATHGFYLEDDSEKPFAQSVNTYSAKESSMVLSGLALSGANNAWKGNFDLPNVEDGILTAYEISQLDLSNTKLVVLSACETARGRIFPVDGVFGLQRAFKQAGAGSILMSLWKVDDNATATFMEYFYKFLFETNDRHKALKMAQDEVRKQYPDPYYWAAWVMLD